MKNKVNKLYIKAMDYYQNGDFDKALNICNKGIEKDLSNKQLLNLNGILFYLKGDLKQAIALWNINRDYNNDDIAKLYIKDSKDDKERLELYNSAIRNFEKLYIDEAIKELNFCIKSDFNTINVNNILAKCYIKKANYEFALEANSRVLKIHKKNSEALSIKKELDLILRNDSREFKKKVIMIATIIALGLILVIKINGFNDNKNKLAIDSDEEKDNTSMEEIKAPIVENRIEDTKVEDKVEEVALTDKDILKVYNEGIDLFNKGDYTKAIEVLLTAVNNTNENYLNQHIVFFLAASYENNNNIEASIKYYEDYVKKYTNGSYIEEVCYKLAILYKDTNKLDKSKEYCEVIINKYPKSIYNNETIEAIISN